jgi:hypothetical protein
VQGVASSNLAVPSILASLTRVVHFVQDFASGRPLLHPVTQQSRAGEPGFAHAR